MNCRRRERKTLKRPWTRFLASVSLAILALLMPPRYGGQVRSSRNQPTAVTANSERVNETRMAGLLPGKSKLRRGEVLFGKSSIIRDANGHTATWAGCDGYQLVVESDTDGTVTSVKAERLLGFKPPAGCGYPMPDVGAWKTSRGLRLWSSHEDVLKLYGKPDSVSPSTKRSEEHTSGTP